MSVVITIRKSRDDWPTRTFCAGDYVEIDEQVVSREAPLMLVAYLKGAAHSIGDTVVLHQPGQHVHTGTGRPRVYRGAKYRLFVVIEMVDEPPEPLRCQAVEIGQFSATFKG